MKPINMDLVAVIYFNSPKSFLNSNFKEIKHFETDYISNRAKDGRELYSEKSKD